MGVMLDETLLGLTKRKTRDDSLTEEIRVAVNLFWRKGVKVPLLAKVFHISKNLLYSRAITGPSESYPPSIYDNQAQETNELIDRLGANEAWNRYVTDDMVMAVNAAMAEDVESRK